MHNKHVDVPKLGMRKIKSVLAIVLMFAVWQLIRIPFPQLDVHPMFGYVYAVIEMRDSVAKTKLFGKRRIKATLIGLFIGLFFLPISIWLNRLIKPESLAVLVDLGLIVGGTLITLWMAELFKCENFCGVAAIIFVICFVRDKNAEISAYLYAILRTMQTVLGVFAAWIINNYICRYGSEE